MPAEGRHCSENMFNYRKFVICTRGIINFVPLSEANFTKYFKKFTNTAGTIKGRVQITNLLYLVNYIEINCIKEKFIFNITRDRQDIIF